MLALMNIREVMIVIMFCTIASLIIRYQSETSFFQDQYQQEQQRYTNNEHDLHPSSFSEFIIPFRNRISLNSNIFGAPIPNNIEELLHNQMPPIPAAYANLADLNEDFQQQQQQRKLEEEPLNDGMGDESQTKKTSQEQVPFFWHIPRTGGATMAQAFGECLGLTLASSASSIPSSSQSSASFQNIFYGNEGEQQPLVVLRHEESKYVNVNLDTDDGIRRAKELQILQQRDENNERLLVNVVISPSVYTTSKILFAFSEQLSTSNPLLPPKGQLFTMIRHPVEREISYFYDLKSSSMDRPLQMGKEEEEAKIARHELSDWLKSSSFLDNIMVRSLINNFDQSYIVTVQDLLVSKEVLRRKCLVGLLEEKGSSWRRMRKYFGESWDQRQRGDLHGMNDASRDECEQKLLFWGWCNRNPRRPYVNHDFGSGGTDFTTNVKRVVDRKSYEQVEILNRWDMILYEYAKYLFLQQDAWFGFEAGKEASSEQ